MTKTWLIVNSRNWRSIALLGGVAGLSGGIAEVLWILLLSAVGLLNASDVAIGVSATLLAGSYAAATGIVLGLIIHLGLSAMLGVALAVMWAGIIGTRYSDWWLAPFLFAALATVWAVNFHIILPAINPQFVLLVPLPLALISKLLFAGAMLVTARGLRQAMELSYAIQERE